MSGTVAGVEVASKVSSDGERGFIIPVGGAERKLRDPTILRRFVELCGGHGATIVVVPTASQAKDTGRRYERIFRDLGAREARAISVETRGDCERSEVLDALERADGVFLTGGNQLRLSTTLGGTPVAQIIRRRNAAGVHVAGTSAGAAFLCQHMIAFGDEGPTPRSGMVTLAPGLGLSNSVIIDQHFRQRDRLGRLLTALAYNPFATGIGIDEDTAAFLGPDDWIEVLGSGALTIIDPSKLDFSAMDSTPEGEPVSLVGIRLHILSAGDGYDISKRQAAPSAEKVAKARERTG
jgi:cyanophycinase